MLRNRRISLSWSKTWISSTANIAHAVLDLWETQGGGGNNVFLTCFDYFTGNTNFLGLRGTIGGVNTPLPPTN